MGGTSGGGACEIRAGGAPLAGHLALPVSGRGRGVLVLHEAFGLVDFVREVCERLAREGFVALAPDLFGGHTAQTLEEAARLSGALEPDALGRDLDDCVDALLARDAVVGPRIGALGFCLGGHLALFAAARNRRIGAVIDFQGFHPALPVEIARIEAAVLSIHSARDEFVPAGHAEALQRSLAAAGRRCVLHVEPEARHGFMNPARPERHAAAAAAAGWERLLAFLRAELQ